MMQVLPVRFHRSLQQYGIFYEYAASFNVRFLKCTQLVDIKFHTTMSRLVSDDVPAHYGYLHFKR